MNPQLTDAEAKQIADQNEVARKNKLEDQKYTGMIMLVCSMWMMYMMWRQGQIPAMIDERAHSFGWRHFPRVKDVGEMWESKTFFAHKVFHQVNLEKAIFDDSEVEL